MRVNKVAEKTYVYEYKGLNVDETFVKAVLRNYESLLASIECARKCIIDDITYLKGRYEEELDSAHITAVNLDSVPFSPVNGVSDQTFNTVWKLEKRYVQRIEAQLDNLTYYEVLEERIRRVNVVFTKLSLVFPIHYLVTYETFVQHKTQDQVRGKMQYAKMTIRNIQTHMMLMTAYVCNQNISVEEINSMSPVELGRLIGEAECFESMKKLEEMETSV